MVHYVSVLLSSTLYVILCTLFIIIMASMFLKGILCAMLHCSPLFRHCCVIVFHCSVIVCSSHDILLCVTPCVRVYVYLCVHIKCVSLQEYYFDSGLYILAQCGATGIATCTSRFYIIFCRMCIYIEISLLLSIILF